MIRVLSISQWHLVKKLLLIKIYMTNSSAWKKSASSATKYLQEFRMSVGSHILTRHHSWYSKVFALFLFSMRFSKVFHTGPFKKNSHINVFCILRNHNLLVLSAQIYDFLKPILRSVSSSSEEEATLQYILMLHKFFKNTKNVQGFTFSNRFSGGGKKKHTRQSFMNKKRRATSG